MKKKAHDDYWPPRQGSWEEAVDPYDVQCSRQIDQQEQQDRKEMPVQAMFEPRPPYQVPVSM